MDIDRSVFQLAVEHFWTARSAAARRQKASGSADRGNRQAVTSGGHLDGFLDAIGKTVLRATPGAPLIDLRRGKRVSVLPGYFRPEKEWDLVILKNGKLGAVIELKAQVGPSFGNNFNNRSEEALGNADDLWTAYREGAFGNQSAPWLGYLFLLEDHPKARTPVRVYEPIYDVFPEFRNTSYAKRYELLLRRMVRERRYTAATLMLSERPTNQKADWTEPAADLGSVSWLRSLVAHLSAV